MIAMGEQSLFLALEITHSAPVRVLPAPLPDLSNHENQSPVGAN